MLQILMMVLTFFLKLPLLFIETNFLIVKTGMRLSYQLAMVLLFYTIIFLITFPQVLVLTMKGCYSQCQKPWSIYLFGDEYTLLSDVPFPCMLDCPAELLWMGRFESYNFIFEELQSYAHLFYERVLEHFLISQSKHTFRHVVTQSIAQLVFHIGVGYFRTFSIADDDILDFMTGECSPLRIIFDSGASTNLVFKPLAGDTVRGKRKLNLACGQTSEGALTQSGEVLLPDAVVGAEELISMGRYALHCGRVVWEGSLCELYIRDQSQQLKLLYTLDVERNCPVLTPEQSNFIRELQRSKINGVSARSVIAPSDDSEGFEHSFSLLWLNFYMPSFEYFYQQGYFDSAHDLMSQFSPAELLSEWEKAAGPLPFLTALETSVLAAKERENKGANSRSSAASSKADHLQKSGSVESDGLSFSEGLDESSLNFSFIDMPRGAGKSDPETPLLGTVSEGTVEHNVAFSQSTDLSKVKVGKRPNAQKAPQKKTPVEDKHKFYKNTKGKWVIFGDIHFASVTGFDQSRACWVFHCSRLKTDRSGNSKKLKRGDLEIETVEINYPIRENTSTTACAALRHALETLGIWSDNAQTKKNFYFHSEVETVTSSVMFDEYLLACHGSHHTSIPYRHPAREVSVKTLLSAIRLQLETSHLPLTAWPAIARAISQKNAVQLNSERVYPNKTFANGYSADMVGRLAYAYVPGTFPRSVQSKQIPVLVLDSAPRNRVNIIHSTEKELGFRYTSVEFSQITFPKEVTWVFESVMDDNLSLRKYMQQPFETRLILKTDGDIPKGKKITCKRCVRLEKQCAKTGKRVNEDGFLKKGHTCDKGCRYMKYDCFSKEHLELAANCFQDCPMALIMERIQELSCKEVQSGGTATEPHADFRHREASGQSERFESVMPSDNCFEFKDSDFTEHNFRRSTTGVPSGEERTDFRRVTSDLRGEVDTFRRLKEFFRVNPLVKDFCYAIDNLTVEDAATFLFLAQPYLLKDFSEQARKLDEANNNPNKEWHETAYALVIPNKVVQDQVRNLPEGLTKWLEASNRELLNLIDRGVLKLVKASELKNFNQSEVEVIPSLVVWSTKSDGKHKCRLVACGNFQIPAAVEEGIQAQNYAGTVSTVVWRSLVTIFAQSRMSIAAMDVSEAFTQTDEASQTTGGRTKRTFLRLPSQWRSRVLPTFLKNAGCTDQNYGQFLLQVLKSIYGETYAPKRWQQTLSRVLTKHGFTECTLEEGMYYRVKNGLLTVVSTYVDDLWFFAMDPDEMVNLMYEISCELRCTPGEILCGAPDWFWDPPLLGTKDPKPSSLSKHQNDVKSFFKPLVGEKRFGVATKADPLSYVSMDVYFEGDMLVLDQSKYMDKAFKKLVEKGVFTEAEVFSVPTLRAEMFSHTQLFEPVDSNPLLGTSELSLLRAGVNTLSFYALNVGVHVQAALGQVSRGQAAGRRRHLEAFKVLFFYAFQHRNRNLKIECPSFLDRPKTIDDFHIFVDGFFDSSLGSSGPLGTDPFARQGSVLRVGVSETFMGVVQGKSSLQSTISLSTCEAELTASTWCARQLIGLHNLLRELFPNVETPVLNGDNRAANLLASNQASIRNHRHLQLPQLWIRSLSKDGKIKILHVDTTKNISDILTKVLTSQTINDLMTLMGYHF